MLKTLLWLLIGIVLMVLCLYLISRINRLKPGKSQRKVSILLSVLEFIVDSATGTFTSLGGLTVIMFIAGLVIFLINLNGKWYQFPFKGKSSVTDVGFKLKQNGIYHQSIDLQYLKYPLIKGTYRVIKGMDKMNDGKRRHIDVSVDFKIN